MNNWIINVQHMLLIEIAQLHVFKIKFNHEDNAVYYRWEDGAWNGWSKCRQEITDEYLRQASIEAERVLLEES